MPPTSFLGCSFECQCGRKHSVPTKYLHYDDNALDRIPETLGELSISGLVLILADQRTYKIVGEHVRGTLTLNGYSSKVFVIPDSGNDPPAADDRTRDLILKEAPHAELYIAIGSGVVNDLTKWVSFLRQKPFFTVATAASMNGYGSANVAATIEGLKVLFHAEACQSVFALPDVIAEAPYEMTTSGLGDVLAKSVSSADWKLNQFLFDDYYCQFSVDLLNDLEPIYLDHPHKIRQKDPNALKALFEALFYSSIAMTITGTSSPASGGEHLISHTMDMLAERDGKKHDFHGRQVGVGAILTASLYEEVMKIDHPVFTAPPEKIDQNFWGSLSPVVKKEYQRKLSRLDKASTFLSSQERWQQLKALIQPKLISAKRLKKCLSEAGGAHRIQDIRDNGTPLSKEKFTTILNNANQMRDRFTILDLSVILGLIPNQIDTLINRWVYD